MRKGKGKNQTVGWGDSDWAVGLFFLPLGRLGFFHPLGRLGSGPYNSFMLALEIACWVWMFRNCTSRFVSNYSFIKVYFCSILQYLKSICQNYVLETVSMSKTSLVSFYLGSKKSRWQLRFFHICLAVAMISIIVHSSKEQEYWIVHYNQLLQVTSLNFP